MSAPVDLEQGCVPAAAGGAEAAGSAAAPAPGGTGGAGGAPAARVITGQLVAPPTGRSSFSAAFKMNRSQRGGQTRRVGTDAAEAAAAPGAPPGALPQQASAAARVDGEHDHVQVLVAAWSVSEDHQIGEWRESERRGETCR